MYARTPRGTVEDRAFDRVSALDHFISSRWQTAKRTAAELSLATLLSSVSVRHWRPALLDRVFSSRRTL